MITRLSKIYYTIFAILIISNFVACELFTEGYGDKVDLSDPELTIDSHSNGEYVSGILTLNGTVTDDTDISTVVVSFISNVTEESKSYNAEFSDSSWTLDIDTTDTAIFEDGEVDFTVTATDSASKVVSKNRIVYIDNTDPTVLISSPNSQDLEGVNGVLYINGVASDQKLKSISLTLNSLDNENRYVGTMSGTNNYWKFEIDTIGLNIISEQMYYIDVIAEDYAGNKNNYFYYGDDLSSSELKTSLGVTNITIEELSSKSNATLLSDIQRSSSENQLKLYIDQDVNIPKIILSSDWDLSSESNYRDFSGDAILSGRVTDDDGVSSITLSLYEGVPSDDDSPVRVGTINASDSRSYSFDINLLEEWDDSNLTMNVGDGDDILSEGVYYFTLEVTDIEGVTANLPNTAKFGNDSKNPVVTIETPLNETSDEVNKNSVIGYNDAITISGTSSDDSGIKSLIVQYSIDEGSYIDAVVTGDTEWSTTLPETNGLFDVKVIATDNANKTTSETIKVKFDNTPPVLEITSPTENEKIYGTDYTIRGTADVEGGSPLTELSFSIDGMSSWVEMTPKFSWSYSGIDFTTGGEGVKTLDIRSKDALNDYSYNTVTFWYDKGAPEFTSITGLEEGVQGLKNSDFDLIINAEDGVALKNITISATKDSIIQDISGDDDPSNDINSKTYTFSTDTETILEGDVQFPINSTELPDGLWAYEIIASDMSGQTVRTTRSVLIDKTAPVSLAINSTTENFVEDILSISGSVTDGTGSGLSSVQYSIDGSEWLELNGTNSWRGPIDVSGLSVGDHNISIRAIDNAGNITSTDVTKNFTIDRVNPVLTVTTQPATGYIKDDIILSGTITDDSVLNNPLTVNVTLDGEEIDIPSNNIDSSETWSVNVPVDDETGDGEYIITLKATDRVGRVDIEEIKVTVDQNAPDITIKNLEEDQIIENTTYTITGSATDSVSGILNVKYRIFDGSEYTQWSEVIGTSNWSLSLDGLDDSITNKVELRSEDNAGNISDISIIPFKVSLTEPILIENNFNSTEIQNINNDVTYGGVYYDGNGLNLTSANDAQQSISTEIENLVLNDDIFGLSSHGFKNGDLILIDSVIRPTITSGNKLLPTTEYFIVNKTDDTFQISSTLGGPAVTFSDNGSDLIVYRWSYTEDIDSDGSFSDTGLVEGSYTLEFIAIDNAGEKTTLTQKIFVDTTAPVLEITKPISGTFSGDINDSDLDTFKGSLSGKVSDGNGIGVTTLQYKIDSGSWKNIDIEYGWSEPNVTFSGVQGARTIYFKASDGLNTTIDNVTVFYDESVPTLTQDIITEVTDNSEPIETEITEDNINSLNFNYNTKLSGTVSDSSSLTSLKLTINDGESISVNQEEYPEFVYDDDVESDDFGTWSYSIEDEGSYNLTFTATDIAGRTTTIQREIIVDTTSPTIDSVIENFGDYLDSSISIEGRASDDTSKIDVINYRFNGSTGDAPSGTFNGKDDWYGSIKVNSSGANLTAGDHTINIWAVDNVGNKSEESSLDFVIDRKSPIIENFSIVDNSNNNYINKNSDDKLNISVTVKEDYGMESLVLSFTDINNENKNIELISSNSSVRDLDTDTITYSYFDSVSLLSSMIPEGTTNFKFIATDKVGKITTKEISLLKDTISPVVEFISPEVTTDVNGIINIKGTTSDSNLESVELYYKDSNLVDNYTLKGAINSTENDFESSSSLYSWTYKLDTGDVTDTGTIDIKIVATDSTGNTSNEESSVISLVIDQNADIPTISDVNSNQIISNSDTTTNSYTVALNHTTSNNILFGYSPAETTDISINVNSEESDRVPVILNDDTSGVYWYLDLSDVGATDSNSVDTNLIVKPLNTLHYIGLRDTNESPNSIIKHFSSNDSLTGYFVDDDKIDVSNSTIVINGESIDYDSGSDSSRVSWSYNGFKESSSGLYFTQITALDYKSYKGSGYGEAVESDVFKSLIVKDITSPVIDAKLKDVAGNELEHQGAYVNGTVLASGSATDDLSISRFTITAKKSTGSVDVVTINSDSDSSNLGTDDIFDIKNSELYSTDDKKQWNWEFALERLPDAYEDTSISLIYEATDVVGNITTVEKSITVDTEEPIVDINYPTEDSTVTGYVTIKGTVDDASLESVYIKLGSNGTEEKLSGTYSWEKEIYTLDTDFYAGSIHYEDTDPLDDIDEEYYDFPVYIRAVDKAGNETSIEDYSFKISPNLDNPIVNITTPSDESKLGGSVQFIGTAEDNTGVDSVWAQIDYNGDGDFNDYYDLGNDDDQFHDESIWYPVDSFSNGIWKLEINKNGELYKSKTDSDNSHIYIQFKAQDDKDSPSYGYSKKFKLSLDDTFPVINDFTTDSGSLDVSGNITLKANITDVNGKIETVSISFDGGISYEPVAYPDSTSYSLDITKTSSELGYEGSSALVNVRLKVTDDTDYTSFSSIILNLDNVSPTGIYTGNINEIGFKYSDYYSDDANTILIDEDTPKPTENDVTIIGRYTDSGMVSSFNRVEVYITQDGKIINPETGESEDPVNKIINGNTILYPDLSSYSDDESSYDNLIIIDNTNEYGVLDLDGDGYKENITLSSGEYIWSTEFNSANININTPIELNYIVYDDAGNANYYSEIMVMVGFDLGDDNIVDESERIAYPVGFSALTNRFYVGVYGGESDGYNISLYNGTTELGTSNSGTTELTIDSSGFDLGDEVFTLNLYKDGDLKLSKELNINFKDDSSPSVITINSLNQNSIVEIDEVKQGHLEMNSNSNFDISGSIRFYGSVSDDTRINDISVTIDGNKTTLTEWDDGLFTGINGLVITSQTQNWKTGHKVSFYYDWDSSTIDNIAKEGVSVRFESTDLISSHDNNENSYDLETYDVVPYITDITTGLENGTKSFLKRTSTGAYTINNSSGEIIIKGFNITNGDIIIGENTYTGFNLVGTSSISLSKSSIINSGSISVKSNGIESINNSNLNSFESNQEPSIYNPNQTDDRAIYVWDVTTTDYEGKTEAVMVPTLNDSGDKTGNMDWMYVENSQDVMINDTQLTTSWNNKGGSFAYNSSGTPMYIYLYNMNFNSSSSSYSYFGSVQWGKGIDGENNSENWHRRNQDTLGLGNLSFNSDSNYSYNTAVMDRYQNLQIEVSGTDSVTNNIVSYLDKGSESRSIVFWSFNVGNGNNTVTKTTQMDNSWYADITKETAGSTNSNYSSYFNIDVGLKTPKGRVELTSDGHDSEYFEMNYDKVNSNVILAYYDEIDSKLKIKYNLDPVNYPDVWSESFTVDEGAGQHVSMITDSNGDSHLAYYDGTGSYLKYAVVSPTLTTDNVTISGTIEKTDMIVDALFTNGMYNSITLKDFGSGDIRPVISSYSIAYGGTENSIRVSWPLSSVGSISPGAIKSSGAYTGDWEVVSVSSDTAPIQEKTFIETDSTAYTGNIVVGYNGVKIETAKLLD